MKKIGDIINGYEIISEPRVVANGTISFAMKDGREYFIKMFNRYLYPSDASSGSEKSKELRRKKALEFENRFKKIDALLAKKAMIGGSVVLCIDFFRWEGKYYKVNEKIESSIDSSEIFKLDMMDRLLVPLTLCSSLETLHHSGIVHGDLKPDNVMISKSSFDDRIVTKLIDFDDAYFSGNPHDDITGDQKFYSPEAAQYAINPKSIDLKLMKESTDVFALGMLTHYFFSGELPGFDKSRYSYLWQSVLDGNKPILFDYIDINPRLSKIVYSMLDVNPNNRPCVSDVKQELKEYRKEVKGGREGLKDKFPPTEHSPTHVTKKPIIKYPNSYKNEESTQPEIIIKYGKTRR